MSDVFGPLNGVRIALVAAVAVAAIVAAALGHWVVSVVFGGGIALHGLGWLYLRRHRHGDLTDR